MLERTQPLIFCAPANSLINECSSTFFFSTFVCFEAGRRVKICGPGTGKSSKQQKIQVRKYDVEELI